MSFRVLFPLDGSEQSFGAMENALRMLKGAKFKATLFVVMHEGFDKAPEDVVEAFDDDDEDEIFPTQAACDRMLDEAEARCKALGLKPERKVVTGRVRSKILEEAKEHDLLVMHALHTSGFRDMIKMSGTERIARKADCSVLLVEDGT